jgi:DNA-binding response OmpR family regulator
MRNALVIEPSPTDAHLLCGLLERAGFHVRHHSDVAGALDAAAESQPSVIVTELAFFDGDGMTLVPALRAQAPSSALMVVTRERRVERKLAALDAGADDFLVKPCLWPELLARVNAVLRRAERTPAAAATVIADGSPLGTHGADWILDHGARTLRRGALEIPLRPKEYDLLCTLCARRGEIVSRGELLRAVWGYAADVTTRTVDSHIFALRRKLEPTPKHPRYILTVSRAGYRLVA